MNDFVLVLADIGMVIFFVILLLGILFYFEHKGDM